MKKLNLMVAVLGLTVSFAVAQQCRAGAFDELNADQQQAVLNGQQVFLTQAVDGAPWPRMFIYQKINCTPLQAEAVTMDYELRPSYTSELTYAKNESSVNGPTMLTDYVMSVPVIGDEHFTMSQTVSTYDNGQSYRLDFHLVRADRTKESDGYTRFEALPGGGTLMAVVSFVNPGVFGASWVVHQAEDRAQRAADGYVQQVQNEVTGNRAQLEQQIQALDRALSQNRSPAVKCN